MEKGPRLDPGWPWWMVAFAVLLWLAFAAGAVTLLIRVRRARARRPQRPPSDGLELSPAGHGDDALEEQRAYYRLRAPEYDEWWQRQGRYDRGEQETAEWHRQVAAVEAALADFDPRGDVLELAGGTGWWTKRLAETAERLTVVDASPETLAINRARVSRADVDYVVADLFDWQPPRQFDVVFFSFWLSHVPRDRFGQFWSTVGAALKPDGRVFLIDNRHDPTLGRQDPYVMNEDDGVQRRRLNDGSEFRVVKVFYEPDELTARLAAEGWRARIGGTRWFIFGSALFSTRRGLVENGDESADQQQ